MVEHAGGCLCGAVRFSATPPLRPVVFCHCSQCRRQTGLYVAATALPKAALQVTGADRVSWFAASAFARRGFCATCGSVLFWERPEAYSISVMAGAFDNPAVLEPGRHICVAGRAGYYEISDGLPQHDHASPGLPIAAPEIAAS